MKNVRNVSEPRHDQYLGSICFFLVCSCKHDMTTFDSTTKFIPNSMHTTLLTSQSNLS